MGGTGLAHAAEAPADVEEIVVTGEKVSRSLQDTVSSVAVVTARRLEQETIQSLTELYSRSANVASAGRYGFSIRGINDASVSGGGAGGLASVYVDGAVLPRRGVQSGPTDLWDAEQIEILRGPQSTLQGRNALAGAIVIRTKDPTFQYTGRARVLVAENGQDGVAAAVGGPLIDNELAFRVAAERRTADGFIYNPIRDEKAQAESSETYRAKLLWTPSAAPGLRALVTYTHADRSIGDDLSRVDTPDFFDNRIATNDYPRAQDTVSDIVTGEVSYEISPELSVTGVASWNKVDYDYLTDLDRGPNPLSFGIFTEDAETFSQEFRVNYESGRLQGLLGVYHAKIDYHSTYDNRTLVTTPVATLTGILTSLFGLPPATAAFAAQTYGQALPVITVDNTQDQPEVIENLALFTDGAFKVTDKLSLLFGARLDRETNTQSIDQVTIFAGTYPDPAAFGALAPVIGGLNQVVASFVAQANAVSPSTKRTFKAFLPKAGVRYEFNDDVSAAFVVQRGYRSGGTLLNIARATVVPYDQEFTTNYELSVRSAWLEGALTLNANAFYIDWKDQQVNVNLGLNDFDNQVANAGSSHLYGFEIELAHRPTAAFDYYVSLGHTRTKFDQFKVVTGGTTLDLTGSEFGLAPRWTIAAGANWRLPHSLLANLNVNYRSATYSGLGVRDQVRRDVDARTLVNAKFGYDRGHWGAYVFGANLLDETYRETGVFNNYATLGAPRVFGALLEARF